MRPRFAFLSALLAAAATLQAHSGTVQGVVRDSASGEPLGGANVRVLGTSRGTITNASGEYALTLESGSYSILFTMLGYAPDTGAVRLDTAARLDARMRPADIILPEIIVTAEDPAVGIIRRAIASKKKWIDRLHTYDMHAFTRRTLLRDTAIASITESFTRGYWRRGDTLREIVTEQRQTENVKPAFNFTSVGQILNFNDDEIRFAGYTFVGPTSPEALDYYEYRLLRTYTIGGHDVYEIRMTPRSRTVPLFRGTVTIAAESYALAGISVEPNEAFQLPFVSAKYLRYRQQFGLYDTLYWMPADIHIDASVTVSFVGISIPTIGIRQTSVITDYSINRPVPDSIFARPRFTVDSSANRPDSAFWASNVVLPLDAREREAYRSLDSTKTLDVQFRPGGAVMTIGTGSASGIVGAGLSLIDFTFNRVEGLHLGVSKTLEVSSRLLAFDAGAAYGFSRKRWTYSAGVTISPLARRKALGLGATAYRIVDHFPDQGYYAPATVGVAALLGKTDYRDYFQAAGWKLFLSSSPAPSLEIRAGYTAEKQSSEIKRTDYSFFFPSRLYPDNPAAEEGMLRSVSAELRVGPEPVPLDILMQNALDLSLERAAPSLLAGDFRFTRLFGVLSFSLPTLGRSSLFPAAFRFRVAAGTSWGDLPLQRRFRVETQVDGFGPFGVMRAGTPGELTGTRMISVNIEHNFRSLPFLALGIPFLYEHNIELVLHGGAAEVWGAAPSARDRYAEVGFGISRIFELARADFTWRQTRPVTFHISIGIAQIL